MRSSRFSSQEPCKRSTSSSTRRELAPVLAVGLVCFYTGNITMTGSLFPSIIKPSPPKEPSPPEPPILDFPRLLHDGITDPWKRTLYARLDRVREQCGALCRINSREDYDQHGIQPQQPQVSTTTNNGIIQYKTFTTPINCPQLFAMEEIDAGDTTVPYPVPEELKPLYSLQGAINDTHWRKGRYKNVYLGGQARQALWTKEDIDNGLTLLQQGQLEGTYLKQRTNEVRDALVPNNKHQLLAGLSVLVVGSQIPWLETVALYAGAANVTTLEYGAINSTHPLIQTMTPEVFRQRYQQGTLPQFDAVLSYSSLEHSGLGRYGDALNPWGDILSLARCWCVAKDNALLLLGLPVGPDAVEFNAHRIYGNIRMPLITTNWKAVDGTTDYQAKRSLHGLHFFRKIGQKGAGGGGNK